MFLPANLIFKNCLQASGAGSNQLPSVDHAPGFQRYQGAEAERFAHEAGYDAYMTGMLASDSINLARIACESLPLCKAAMEVWLETNHGTGYKASACSLSCMAIVPCKSGCSRSLASPSMSIMAVRSELLQPDLARPHQVPFHAHSPSWRQLQFCCQDCCNKSIAFASHGPPGAPYSHHILSYLVVPILGSTYSSATRHVRSMSRCFD